MTITAKFSSKCPVCECRIYAGNQVEWSRGSKAVHVTCASTYRSPSGAMTGPEMAIYARRQAAGLAGMPASVDADDESYDAWVAFSGKRAGQDFDHFDDRGSVCHSRDFYCSQHGYGSRCTIDHNHQAEADEARAEAVLAGVPAATEHTTATPPANGRLGSVAASAAVYESALDNARVRHIVTREQAVNAWMAAKGYTR